MDSKKVERYWTASVIEILKKHILKNSLTYYIETYGCQMNVHESEKLTGVIEGLGYHAAEDKTHADLIIFNTCCVREHAEARLYGNVGALREYKENKKTVVIGVCGCMMQQNGAAKKLAVRFQFVDIIFGSNHIHQIDQMLYNVLIERRRVICTDEDETIIEGLPAVRNSTVSAFVNIIYGCNNFCTYCIVPFVRGRERSRKSDDIIDEINKLCIQGISEITLLGQNVNSYGKGSDISFPQLLERIDSETDVKRLRFMTSHPKDLTEELIDCYGRLNSLCEHIHLPVQSGSDSVLKRMNRGYTREHYLGLIRRLRELVPDIAVTTDIIVGFPGETEEDFADTIALVKEIKYDAAYTFAYSKRALTKAANMPEQIDKATKKDRLKRLNSVINASVIEKNKAYIGKNVEVLVDNFSKRDDNEIGGKTRTAKTVNFKGNADEIGRYVTVKIDKAKVHTLHGVRPE